MILINWLRHNRTIRDEDYSVRSFNPLYDLERLQRWTKEWNVPSVDPKDLPKIGLISKEIAMGFLTTTNSNFAILDYYITDKNALKNEREAALQSVTKSLIRIAKEDGFDKIIAITDNPAIFKYCNYFGFKDLGRSQVFARRL